MHEPSIQPFDDPALKAALRRALGRESAPVELRGRVEGVVGQPSPLARKGPLYRLAVAAVLILGFGALGYQIWQMNRAPVYSPDVALSDSLYQAMVDAHTARAGQATGDGVSTLVGASSLGGQIGRPVLVADLSRDGWTFQGAAVRNVGSHSAAQLFFTKGKAAISVFSLPAASAPGAKDNVDYDKVFNGAPIAGFVRGGGLYCIVGSSADGSLQVDEVKRLLAAHRGEIGKG